MLLNENLLQQYSRLIVWEHNMSNFMAEAYHRLFAHAQAQAHAHTSVTYSFYLDILWAIFCVDLDPSIYSRSLQCEIHVAMNLN